MVNLEELFCVVADFCQKFEPLCRKEPLFHAYSFLFCLTIIAINPFALFRGTIWTQPKILCVACIVVLHLLVLWQTRRPLKLSNQWRLQAFGWMIFLIFGLISTLLSPFPGRSFFGHGITADGWLYWFLLAGLVLTNSFSTAALSPFISLAASRTVSGCGAGLHSACILNMLNWKLDYTIHSGQLWPETEHVLATAVYRNHQPIGLYSHRGYASFTLAMASVLSLVAMRNRWLSARVAIPLIILCSVTLSLSKVRGALLAMLAGWLWLTITAPQRQSIRRLLIALSLIGILSFSWATIERRVGNAEIYASTPFEIALKHFTSDRIYLWKKAWKGILDRPWLGWGFSGYSIADATYLCPKQSELIALEDYYAYCQLKTNKTKEVIEVATESTKAHNLILDKYVSLGVFGASSYFLLLNCYIF